MKEMVLIGENSNNFISHVRKHFEKQSNLEKSLESSIGSNTSKSDMEIDDLPKYNLFWCINQFWCITILTNHFWCEFFVFISLVRDLHQFWLKWCVKIVTHQKYIFPYE
jgi:hypothetical protein